MDCSNQILHTIKPGDNLYCLSKYYQTTVPMIMKHNPEIDPYQLQIGTQIIICPGPNFSVQANKPSACPNFNKKIKLINDMRLAWSQHVYWTRMVIISIAEKLKDQQDVTNRLLQNPGDLARIFSAFYPSNVTQMISQLLTEHLKIGAALVTALRDGKSAEADKLNRQWFQNADKMAEAFSSINPYYNKEEIRRMFYQHLDLTKQEAAMRLAGNYPADIEAFDAIEQQIMMMADMFTSGIIQQFPQSF